MSPMRLTSDVVMTWYSKSMVLHFMLKFARNTLGIIVVLLAGLIALRSEPTKMVSPASVTLADDFDHQLKTRNAMAKYLPKGRWTGEAYLRGQIKFLLNSKRELVLSDAEQNHIVEIYYLFQSIRADFEAKLVQDTSSRPDALSVKIDPYPEAGKRLRDLFQQELINKLGRDRFEYLDDYMGEIFDSRFLGFGICVQTVTISVQKWQPAGEFWLERTAKVVGEMTASRVAQRLRFGGSGTSFPIKLSELEEGELSYMKPLIEAKFTTGIPK